MDDRNKPNSRADAKALQAVRYHTGRPCLRGHVADRFTSTGQCVECVNTQNAHWRALNREKVSKIMKAWRERQPRPAPKPSASLSSRERNRRYRLKKRGFQNANPNIQCVSMDPKVRWAIYYESNKSEIARVQRDYRDRNRDALKAAWKDWYSKNRVSQLEKAVMRRKKVLDATPGWLTAEDRANISALYFLAVRESSTTGVEHHVDHIVPIAGRTVCGLHVPWNLRVIPATENLKKGNKLLDFHPTSGRLV